MCGRQEWTLNNEPIELAAVVKRLSLGQPRAHVRALLRRSAEIYVVHYLWALVGAEPPGWHPETWQYKELAFVADAMPAGDLAAALTPEGTITISGLSASCPAANNQAYGTQQPSYSRYGQPCVSVPTVDFTLHPAERSDASQLPYDMLVGADSPSFPSPDHAYRAFFHGDFSGSPSSGPRGELALIRMAATEAWLGSIRISTKEMVVEIHGDEVKGARLELSGPVNRTESEIEAPGTVVIPLSNGLPKNAWLWIKRGTDWLDYRAFDPQSTPPEALAASGVTFDLALEPATASATPPEDTARRFTSDLGREYQYDPEHQLSSGSLLTQVFRGTDADGRAIAVKQVRIRLDSSGRRRTEPRLAEREVEIARQLRDAHGEHLVPVLDYAHHDGELLLVMPLAECSLAQRIAESGQLASNEVRAMLLDVAQAMQELSVAGVLHRDIKPGNILRYNGHWCLADFGISRIIDAATVSVSWMGSGTVEYQAPELLDGKPETQLSDEYSLGLSALEALTGRRAISGTDLRQAHALLIPTFPEDTDPLLRRAVAELLNKDPGARPLDPRRITELLRPAGTMSGAQRGLQNLRARKAERDLEHSAYVAQAEEHTGWRRQARVSFTALWRRLVEHAEQAVDDAKAAQDSDVYTLEIGDAAMRVHLSEEPTQVGPLLLTAEVYIVHSGESRIVGNLYCTNDEGVLRWRLIQFKDRETGASTGHKTEAMNLFWSPDNENLAAAANMMSKEADAEAILEMFAQEGLTGSAPRQPDEV